jgi:hypothetical protein
MAEIIPLKTTTWKRPITISLGPDRARIAQYSFPGRDGPFGSGKLVQNQRAHTRRANAPARVSVLVSN